MQQIQGTFDITIIYSNKKQLRKNIVFQIRNVVKC